MDRPRELTLLDRSGQPFHVTVATVLEELASRVRRRFPTLAADDALLISVLEEAGERIQRQQRAKGSIEQLHWYAWRAVQRAAVSHLRRKRVQMWQATVQRRNGPEVLADWPSVLVTPQRIEQQILLRQVLARLTPRERAVCVRKFLGYTSEEIAQAAGSTPHAIDLVFARAKRRIRALMSPPATPSAGDESNRRKRG